MDGLLEDFLTEARDTLAQLDADLLALARQPLSAPLRTDIFQALRTIKTTSAFVGLRRVSRAAAAGESLAVRLRSGAVPVTPRAIRELGELTHAIGAAVATAARTGSDARFDLPSAVAGVAALQPVAEAPLAAAVRESSLFGLRAVRLVSRPLRNAVSRLDSLAESSAASLGAARDQLTG
jgi:two-component system chemotaxis sensor kinase CheA